MACSNIQRPNYEKGLFLSIGMAYSYWNMIDLHCHSCFSDGLLRPDELIQRAILQGVKIFSLTDHDTLEGLSEFSQAKYEGQIQLIDGIEWSTLWKKKTIHVIALGIDRHEEEIKKLIDKQNQIRRLRAEDMGRRFEALGLFNAYQKACVLAGHENIGRPHFAQVLVQEGFVVDMAAAFKRYLGDGAQAFVKTDWLDLKTIIDVTKRSGGQAVIAHPSKYKWSATQLKAFIKVFKEWGGVGIEVVSGDTPLKVIEILASLSVQYDLLASSGSDFHGDGLSRVGIGKQARLPLKCKPIWQVWA